MGNDLSLLYKYKSEEDKDNLYARRYLEDSNKNFFIDKIKEKNKKKLEQDPDFQVKKITEPLIIQEAFSQFLHMEQKEKLTLLMNHPALSKQDFQDLLELSVKSTERAFYTSVAGSLVTFLIYKKWIERHHMFYNFFRKNHKYKAVGIMKKGFAGLVLFYSWLAATNYYQKEKMRRQIEEKGYLKRYYIDDSVYLEGDT